MAKLTPLKAVRNKCIDCSGGSYKEVAQCPIVDCPLYPYRFGKRPKNNSNESDSNSKGSEN